LLGWAIVSKVVGHETRDIAIHPGHARMATATRPKVLILGANGRLGLAAVLAARVGAAPQLTMPHGVASGPLPGPEVLLWPSDRLR